VRAQMDVGLKANSLLVFPIKNGDGSTNVSMNLDENTSSCSRQKNVRTEGHFIFKA
jgi:dihydroxyacetone kinase-like predicted kinase